MADVGEKESKATTWDKYTIGHKVFLCFYILLVVSIFLTVALLIRIELKFQQIDAALLNEVKSSDNSKHGKLNIICKTIVLFAINNLIKMRAWILSFN